MESFIFMYEVRFYLFYINYFLLKNTEIIWKDNMLIEDIKCKY